MPGIGPMELVIVLIIALIVLGPKRLPDAGRALGDGIRQFKGSIGGDTPRTEDADADIEEPVLTRAPSSR